MMVGDLPFKGHVPAQIAQLVFQGIGDTHIRILKSKNVSILARRMIEQCLEVNCKQRISARKITLNPWFFAYPEKTNNNICIKSKQQVFDKMHEQYLSRYTAKDIELAVRSRPYGRVAGLYRMLNVRLEEQSSCQESKSIEFQTKKTPVHTGTKKSVRFDFTFQK